MVSNSEVCVSDMPKADPRKGKVGKSGKKVVLGPGVGEDGQGGTGEGVVKETEELEVEPNVDTLLYEELSEEQRAVDKAVEVQAERDKKALEVEALKEELRAAKDNAARMARREALEVRRHGLMETIAGTRRGHEPWVLTGDRRDGSEADETRGGSPGGAEAGARGVEGAGPGRRGAGEGLCPGRGGGGRQRGWEGGQGRGADRRQEGSPGGLPEDLPGGPRGGRHREGRGAGGGERRCMDGGSLTCPLGVWQVRWRS